MTIGTGTNKKWEIWKTITLGTHKTARDLRRFMSEKGFAMDYLDNHLFDDIEVSPVEKMVDLVKLPYGPSHLFCLWGNLRGLKMCPTEVGPQLRIQYPDQNEQIRKLVSKDKSFSVLYESIDIAMNPLKVGAYDSENFFPTELIFNLSMEKWLHFIPPVIIFSFALYRIPALWCPCLIIHHIYFI